VRQMARRYERLAGVREGEDWRIGESGRLLAQAYPDRIARRRPDGAGQFRLANGRGASLPPADPLAAEEFLAVAHLDGDRREARIFLAAPLARADFEADFAAAIETVDTIAWVPREEAVVTRRQRRFGALVIADEPLAHAPPERVAAALAEGIRSLGLAVLPWHGGAQGLRQRIRFLSRLQGQVGWPDLSDAALLKTAEDWLGPYLAGIKRRAQFEKIDLAAAIAGLLRPDQRRLLDRLAPTHATVPSGSRVPIDYGAGETPVLAVRLQEMFGARDTPAIVEGRVPLVLHLLSPAARPLQVTRDLASFWRSIYPELRGVLRGRYPRHPWPERPLEAVPTARAVRRARTGPGR
jgi:ATP-dependent helicase HrpB